MSYVYLYAQASDIMTRFDFDRVHTVMEALNWTWAFSPTGVPSTDELKSSAYELLCMAVDGYANQTNKDVGYYVSTGGFTAEVVTYSQSKPNLQLSFCVESREGR